MTILNFLFSMAIFYLIVCRVYKMEGTAWWAVVSYSALGAAAIALAIAPVFWGLEMHPAIVFFTASHFAVMLSMTKVWRFGAPASLRSKSAPNPNPVGPQGKQSAPR